MQLIECIVGSRSTSWVLRTSIRSHQRTARVADHSRTCPGEAQSMNLHCRPHHRTLPAVPGLLSKPVSRGQLKHWLVWLSPSTGLHCLARDAQAIGLLMHHHSRPGARGARRSTADHEVGLRFEHWLVCALVAAPTITRTATDGDYYRSTSGYNLVIASIFSAKLANAMRIAYSGHGIERP